jgi:hypothetical protein
LVLYDYLCVFAHSRFIENPPIWSWETNPSFLRWFCHKDAYRKVGALIEHEVKVILCGCSITVGEDMAIRAIHPPGAWDNHCCVVWALRHGCCLRGDKGREKETEWMTTFVWCQVQKFDGKRWHRNNLSSNGCLLTSSSSLLLMIKVKYIILKNKSLRNWLHKAGVLMICIGFYYDIEPSNNIVVPRLVRTNISTVLYETIVCITLFNTTSPRFNERGGTNM